MKQYKGYYIDNVIFNNESEIDKHIENKAVEAYMIAVKLFMKECNIEYSMYVNEKAENLVNNFGYTWEQVEELEIKFMSVS